MSCPLFLKLSKICIENSLYFENTKSKEIQVTCLVNNDWCQNYFQLEDHNNLCIKQYFLVGRAPVLEDTS